MSRLRPRKAMADINVVPYIDVMLVLLVIFMITTPLLSQGVNVDLPQAKAKPLKAKDQEPIIVSVDKQGRYFLNVANDAKAPLAPQQLAVQVAARLQLAKKAKQAVLVLVKGDKDVDYGRVVQAMVLLQRAGAARVGLMTQGSAKAAA